MPLNLTLAGLDVDAHYNIIVGGEEIEPLIFLDFKNGVYMADGDVVALNTLLTENTDYGGWNPAHIQAGVGLVASGTNDAPVFTGDALALVLGGATILTSLSEAGGTAQRFRYELTDDLSDYNLYYYSNTAFRDVDDSFMGDQTHDDVIEENVATGAHKIALTMTNGKISRSTDGAAVLTLNPAAAWSPAPQFMGFVSTIGMILESIGLYPAQADAELPGLSTP